MSRYLLHVAKNPNHEISVGWDRPLQSLFWDVVDRTKPEYSEGWELLTSHLGKPGQHLTDVDQMIEAIRPYVDEAKVGMLFDRMKIALLTDMAER